MSFLSKERKSRKVKRTLVVSWGVNKFLQLTCELMFQYTGLHIKKKQHSPNWRETLSFHLPVPFYTDQWGALFDCIFLISHSQEWQVTFKLHSAKFRLAAIWRCLCVPLNTNTFYGNYYVIKLVKTTNRKKKVIFLHIQHCTS